MPATVEGVLNGNVRNSVIAFLELPVPCFKTSIIIFWKGGGDKMCVLFLYFLNFNFWSCECSALI